MCMWDVSHHTYVRISLRTELSHLGWYDAWRHSYVQRLLFELCKEYQLNHFDAITSSAMANTNDFPICNLGKSPEKNSSIFSPPTMNSRRVGERKTESSNHLLYTNKNEIQWISIFVMCSVCIVLRFCLLDYFFSDLSFLYTVFFSCRKRELGYSMSCRFCKKRNSSTKSWNLEKKIMHFLRRSFFHINFFTCKTFDVKTASVISRKVWKKLCDQYMQ